MRRIYAMTFDYTSLAELYPTRSYKRRAGSVPTSDSGSPRRPYASLWRSFRLSFSRALILRSKRKGSTASKFACCMRAKIIHFLASCLSGALGFDGVDAGGLDESWRQQPGTPVYT